MKQLLSAVGLSAALCVVGASCKSRNFNAQVANDSPAGCASFPYVDNGSQGHFLFHWTRSPEAIRDPAAYLETTSAGAADFNAKHAAEGFPMSARMGGGAYFAGDPSSSFGAYGRILVISRIRPASSFPGSDCAPAGKPIVYASESHPRFKEIVQSSVPGLFYSFGQGEFASYMALVTRGKSGAALVPVVKVIDLRHGQDSAPGSASGDTKPSRPFSELGAFTFDPKADLETLVTLFSEHMDLLLVYKRMSPERFAVGGKVSDDGILIARASETLGRNHPAYAKWRDLVKARGWKRETTFCADDFVQCVEEVIGALDARNATSNLRDDDLIPLLKAFGWIGESTAVSNRQELRAAVFASWRESRGDAGALAFLSLGEAIRQRLQSSGIDTWPIPENAF